MKTIEDIIQQNPVFLNDWSDEVEVFRDFYGKRWSWEDYEDDEVLEYFKGDNILFASYGYANYSGDAWVLFERDGKLFEVNGGHCSCHGLEGQWEPEEVVLEELHNRLLHGTFGEDDWSDNNFKQELCEFLGIGFKKNMN
ncbi:integrase [Bacillus phage Shbh1]|uniref:Uncharacterized protein n=1 Tax=Bacillus phage Shbh1 TaxID=1796992 RepID=A0A142F137_9CAUD|nr:integrase [Bacillus phage Shbh1]AMQ66494.1 hypothetical protein [Bacillus phage Shbh1]